MNVKFGTTTKRINSISTAFNSDSATTLDCKLKENCSRHDPIFIVQGLSKSRHYNYCEWKVDSSATYYYWITDVVYISNTIQEVHCKLDPLGTFAGAITGSSQYCVYADENHWNKVMDDIRITPEHLMVETTLPLNDVFGGSNGSMFSQTGCIIMTFFQAIDMNTSAGLHTGIFDIGNFHDCLKDLSQITWFNPSATDALMELVQLIAMVAQNLAGGGSWADCIYQINWVPFNFDYIKQYGNYHLGCTVGGLTADTCGWYEISTNTIITKSSTGTSAFDIGSYWTTNTPDTGKQFLRNPRFTTMQLETQSGSQSVDTSILTQSRYICCKSAVNIASGDWAIKLTNETGSGQVLANASGSFAIDLKHLAIHAPDNVTRAVVGAYSTMANLTMNAVGAEFAQQTGVSNNQLIQGMLNTQAPSCSLNGASPCLFLNNPGQILLNIATFAPVDISNYKNFCNRHGYPCNKWISLNGVSGFVKCYNASIAPSGATPDDINFINSCLNNGIYL